MMKFKILSVKGNSVRVSVGMITFDVKVEEINGRLKMILPRNIYIADTQDFDDLVRAVIYEYSNHLLGVNHYGHRERTEVNQVI